MSRIKSSGKLLQVAMRSVKISRFQAVLLTLLSTVAMSTSSIWADATTRPATVVKPVVFLQSQLPWNHPKWIPCPLYRELYRQALSIAARDGLGLETRDGSLREWTRTPPADSTIKLSFLGGRWLVFRFLADGNKAIWHEDFQVPEVSILDRVEHAEILSRTDLVDVLEADGFVGHANNVKSGAPASDSSLRSLEELDEISQFSVVRETHRLIRNDAESESRLGVLVRAYANLGQLTRFHWSIEHDVFAARSLLYAQRMVVGNPKSPVPLWHRAYAMAMAGWQAQALDDLANAKRLNVHTEVPPWVPFVEAFCHYDYPALTDLAGKDQTHARLALFLAFRAVESSRCQALALKIWKPAYEANPRCVCLVDAMCELVGPGLLNSLVEEGPNSFGQLVLEKLDEVPGIPDSATQRIAALKRDGLSGQGLMTLCNSLIDGGDPAIDTDEPSLAALGRELQETNFAQIRRYANVIALEWGVGAAEFASQSKTLVSDHPFKSVIEAYGAWHEPTFDHAGAALRTLRVDSFSASELQLFTLENSIQSGGQGTSDKVLARLFYDSDSDSFSQEAWLNLYRDTVDGGEYPATALRNLRQASPESPWLLRDRIRNDWNSLRPIDVENSPTSGPLVLQALALKYFKLKKFDDAIRCWKEYIAESPDMTGYTGLADVYDAERKTELWLATLQEFLNKAPEIGLEHAEVQCMIANYYMSKGDYRTALPYADAAAQTASAWGLLCAAQAHAGIGDYDVASQLYSQEYEHYLDSPFVWYAWCERSGHGNLAAATAAMRQYEDTVGKARSEEDYLRAAAVDLVQGDKAAAIGELQQRVAKWPGPFGAASIMIFADELGDLATRDNMIEQLSKLPTEGSWSLFVRELARAYSSGPEPSLNLSLVDGAIAKCGPVDQIGMAYLTARFLDAHGTKDLAAKYVRRCYFGFPQYSAAGVMADQLARSIGFDPSRLDQAAIQAATQPTSSPVTEPVK